VSHHELDVRFLLCPMPVIRTQNRVTELVPGDTLEVFATDPGALHDIPAWCRVQGHEVLTMRRDINDICITLRVGNP
jgi:tRNA 2-thiouridine synthesizing protein A